MWLGEGGLIGEEPCPVGATATSLGTDGAGSATGAGATSFAEARNALSARGAGIGTQPQQWSTLIEYPCPVNASSLDEPFQLCGRIRLRRCASDRSALPVDNEVPNSRLLSRQISGGRE
jgi:hypothetical protein